MGTTTNIVPIITPSAGSAQWLSSPELWKSITGQACSKCQKPVGELTFAIRVGIATYQHHECWVDHPEFKPIETRFKYRGYDHEQVTRDGDLAIYRQSKPGIERFEVIKIKRHKGYEIEGRIIPPGEAYPSDSNWGTLGFTCSTMEYAIAKLEQLKGAK